MNKMELVEALSNRSGCTKKESEAVLNAFIDTVANTLQERGKVQLVGFGTFETRERAARKGRNPKNPQQEIDIPGKTVPVFKAGKTLKDLVK